MAIIKIKKRDTPYVILDKTCLEDKQLSWKAKGLHSFLMSLPLNWEVRIQHLITCSRDGRDAVYSAFRELSEFGYIVCNRERNVNGHYQAITYDVHELPLISDSESSNSIYGFSGNGEKPINLPYTDNPDTGIPDSVNPDPENPRLINNKYTNYPNTNNTTTAINAAAESLELFGKDNSIGDELTVIQLEQIEKRLKDICTVKSGLCFEVLREEVKYVLLDKMSFTAAGRNFAKKLNSIIKVIKNRKWSSPVRPETTKKVCNLNEDKAYELKQRYLELKGEYSQWVQLLKLANKGNKKNEILSYQDLMKKTQAELDIITKELMEIKKLEI